MTEKIPHKLGWCSTGHHRLCLGETQNLICTCSCHETPQA